MRLLNRKKKEDRQEAFINCLNIDTGNWFQVFSACLGKMMSIQTACADIVVTCRDWNVDFTEGMILFGEQRYPIQFIGSESTSGNTWLWGWENVNNFSDKMLHTARQTKRLGEQWKLEPLTTAEFTLDHTFNGHNLSIVTCGLSERCCYYRGPHAGGAIFVAFTDVPEEVFAAVDIHRFISITTQCIQQFHIDHKIFVESFLLWNGTDYDWEGDTVTARFQQDLKIRFEQAEENLRICSMTNR